MDILNIPADPYDFNLIMRGLGKLPLEESGPLFSRLKAMAVQHDAKQAQQQAAQPAQQDQQHAAAKDHSAREY